MQKVKSVDEYIASAPIEIRDKLTELRSAIKESAPNAEEKISYGMPYYGYKGRLVYFAYAKDHIGLYGMPYALDELKDELKDFRTVTFLLFGEMMPNIINGLLKCCCLNNANIRHTK